MAKKNTSTQKSQERKGSEPSQVSDSVTKNKTMLYALIGIAILVFGSVVLFTSEEKTEPIMEESVEQSPQEESAEVVDETENAAGLITFREAGWPEDITAQCKNCKDSPAGCERLKKTVAYSCELPSGLPDNGKWACTRKVDGAITGSTTKGSCSLTFNNYFQIRPDEASDVTVCCIYTYTENGQQKSSEEYCGTQTYALAC